MSYFDSIQTEADGRALGALLSKRPEEILNEKPETLSEGFYLIGAQEMMSWILSKDAETLNRLLDAMGERDFSANAPFLKGFQQAGIKMGDSIELAMDNQYSNSGELHSEQMSAYNKYLALTDKFVALMESLYVMEIGTVNSSSGSFNNGGKLYQVETKTRVKISDISDATFRFQTTVDTKSTTLEKNSGGYIYPISISKSTDKHHYTMEEYATAAGNNMAEKLARLGELEASRKQARKDLAITLAKGFGYTTLAVFAPEVVPIVSMIDSLATSDGAKFGKQFGSMIDKNLTIGGTTIKGGFTKTGAYNFGVALPTEALQNYAKYVDKLKGFDRKAEETRIQMIDDFLNRGRTYLYKQEGDSSIAISRFQPHNFYAAARLREMDNQGLVPYVEYAKSSKDFDLTSKLPSTQEIIQEAINEVNKTNSDNKGTQVSSEMRKYLLGERTDLSLVNMTTDQLETYKDVLNRLPISSNKNVKNGYEEYQLYLNGKY